LLSQNNKTSTVAVNWYWWWWNLVCWRSKWGCVGWCSIDNYYHWLQLIFFLLLQQKKKVYIKPPKACY